MAREECTIFIIDVGKSTGTKRHGRHKTDLNWSMEYVWDKLTTIVSIGRKTLYVGVLGLRTDGTDHNGPTEEEYNNIKVLKYPSQMLIQDVRNLSSELKASDTDNGDAISAIILAIQIIQKLYDRPKNVDKRIILTTNCTGNMDADLLDGIAEKLKADNIELTVLGVDLDDPDYGFKEEEKDESKERNEQTLKELVGKCDGIIGTLKQAVDELQNPRIYIPATNPTFKGKLTLGDSETYETAMEIDVERYPKVMLKSAKTPKKITVKTEESQQNGDNLANGVEPRALETSFVHRARTYQIKDENAPGGKRDVDTGGLAKGYEYGRETVVVDPSDEENLSIETSAGMSIMGFVPRDNIGHFWEMTKANVIIAQKTNDLAAMAFSSLVHTLYELDTCAIARFVPKNNQSPVIVALIAWIEPNFQCLVDTELPFAEDFRQHKFPPLDRIPTLSGKVITEHRNIPSEQLKSAMSTYVDSMDLSGADRDEEGEEIEYLKFEDAFSPRVNRIDQAIKSRAVHPDDPVPAPLEALTRFSHPPEHIMKHAQKRLDAMMELADVKKVPPKSLARRNFRSKKNQEAPRSGLDVTTLLNERSAGNQHLISPQNAIPEFKQMMNAAEDIETVTDGIKQLSIIIKNWIRTSMGDRKYGRVCEAIGTMKHECVELEVAETFNDFLRQLKKEMFAEELGGDRRELWWQLRTSNLGLIKRDAAPEGGVDEDEAREFLIPDRTRI